MSAFLFKDRTDAGRKLAEALKEYSGSNTLILAIPRGGVPVAAEVSRSLGVPMDIFLSKKIGYPENKEFAVGAITEDEIVLEPQLSLPENYLSEEIPRLRKIMEEKKGMFKGKKPFLPVHGKTVIVIDDGIATGYTLLVTLRSLRKLGASSVIVAVPVAPEGSDRRFRNECDKFICLETPPYFSSVGEWYEDFSQVEDEEVTKILNES